MGIWKSKPRKLKHQTLIGWLSTLDIHGHVMPRVGFTSNFTNGFIYGNFQGFSVVIIQPPNKLRWESKTSWWLNQPIWKICSSNWIISPSRGENTKYLKPPPRRNDGVKKTNIWLSFRKGDDVQLPVVSYSNLFHLMIQQNQWQIGGTHVFPHFSWQSQKFKSWKLANCNFCPVGWLVVWGISTSSHTHG